MPDSKVSTWQDVRPNWPNQKIKLFGPGTDSGTFGYFTDVINGKSQVWGMILQRVKMIMY